MKFDFENGVPIYQQIATEIEDAILSGAFPEEEQIPSTTEISVQYKINPATILKGINLLVEEQILYKKRGVGMFVQSGAVKQILRKRRQQFYDHYIVTLLEEAKKLNIETGELISMIEEGNSDGSY